MGKNHTQKVDDYINALEKILRVQKLDIIDKSIAKGLLKDLIKAKNK